MLNRKCQLSVLTFDLIQYLSKESDILFCSITHANLGQKGPPHVETKKLNPYTSTP